jgi:TolB-like protein
VTRSFAAAQKECKKGVKRRGETGVEPGIRLFGTFQAVGDDGTEAQFATRKAVALVAILAADAGAEYSRDTLAAMLWPTSGEGQARASLRQTLAQARKALSAAGLGRIESTRNRLRLETSGVLVDARAVVRVEHARDEDRLEQAVQAYRGPFLEGIGPIEDPFDEWVRDRRRYFEEAALRSIQRLLDIRAEAGRLDEAVALAERGLALEPTRESLYRELMRLHLAAGQRGEAVKSFERCRRVLRERLGVPPGPETEALRRTILGELPELTLDTSPVVPPAGVRAASVAVLPFDNLSEDPEQGYFADGIAEDIITGLSRFKTLAVTSRNSSFAYRGQGAAVREIAAELGVSYVLEGSVRRAGDRLRVTAQLVDGRVGTQLWADRFDVPLGSMFDVQDEITGAVVGALALNIDGAHLERARRSKPEDLAAYDLWLHGLECLRKGTPESDEEARVYFERALTIDPHYARGYAGISLSHFNEWSCQAWNRWEERERGAFDNALRALELDDGDHLVHCILGRVYGYRKEFALADKHFDRALDLNPNDADCLMHIALGKALLGHHGDAAGLAETAFALNPRHGDWYYGIAALPSFLLGKYEAALRHAERAPDIFVDSRLVLAAIHARLGQEHATREDLARFLQTFRERITYGRDPEPGEPMRWFFRINPFRLESDQARVKESLSLAGLK